MIIGTIYGWKAYNEYVQEKFGSIFSDEHDNLFNVSNIVFVNKQKVGYDKLKSPVRFDL